MTTEFLMKCRECKKQYESDEWKETGNSNGFCSDKCRKEHLKKCNPSHLSKVLTKELNKIEVEK